MTNTGVSIPADFAAAVKDIKLAILQARAKAARLANAEALKLYFFVGGYISKKTRNAKWGSGAIDALSQQLQVELPGLRGFSSQHMRFMRQFFEAWAFVSPIQHLVNVEFRYLPSSEFQKPLGIATYSTLRAIPKPYKTLSPVIEGVKRVMSQVRKVDNRSNSTKEVRS